MCEDSCYTDSVCIYDSGFLHMSLAIKNTICQFLQPKPDTFFFDLMNIQSQPNGNDCGLFALACATELVHGDDPHLCNWDLTRMRIYSCPLKVVTWVVSLALNKGEYHLEAECENLQERPCIVHVAYQMTRKEQ